MKTYWFFWVSLLLMIFCFRAQAKETSQLDTLQLLTKSVLEFSYHYHQNGDSSKETELAAIVDSNGVLGYFDSLGNSVSANLVHRRVIDKRATAQRGVNQLAKWLLRILNNPEIDEAKAEEISTRWVLSNYQDEIITPYFRLSQTAGGDTQINLDSLQVIWRVDTDQQSLRDAVSENTTRMDSLFLVVTDQQSLRDAVSANTLRLNSLLLADNHQDGHSWIWGGYEYTPRMSVSAGWQASLTDQADFDADSINYAWAWSRVGGKIVRQKIDSPHKLTFQGEWEVAAERLVYANFQQNWDFGIQGLKLQAGQFRGLPLMSYPEPNKLYFSRLPDASKRFTKEIAGFALGGSLFSGPVKFGVEVAVFNRQNEDMDPFFSDFQVLDEGTKWSQRFVLESKWAEACFSWEQNVGHNLMVFSQHFSWFQPRLGWSHYLNQREESLDLYFAENTTWIPTLPLALSGRLDFSDQKESLQLGILWRYMPDSHLQLFYDTRDELTSLGLSCSMDW
jgi:hypothetical protein